MRYLWGIDLGGTKVEGVILDSENNNGAVSRLRLPTEKGKGYEHILGQIWNVIKKMSSETGLEPSHVGIGTPGVVDPNSRNLKNSNTTCLNGRPFHDDLESLTGLSIKTSNDANCFAIAETLMGTIQDLEFVPEVVFGVIMGTGVGGGIVVNGKVINGMHGIGGEWGHNVLEPNGDPCYCGKVGCVEQVISGPALERYYKKISGEGRSLKEIATRHKNNEDANATKTINRMISFFGEGIAPLLNTIDPAVVVLGGGVGNIPDLADRAADAAKPYIFNHGVETLFLRPKLGDSAGVFGAALLWVD